MHLMRVSTHYNNAILNRRNQKGSLLITKTNLLTLKIIVQIRNASNFKKKFRLDALPFLIKPDEAYEIFEKWAKEEQGLSYLLSSTRISASYVPVWSFDVNVRFINKYNWKPEPFDQTHANQSTIHIPGLAAYAGYSYRRSLIHPIHKSSLVFLGDQTMPFQSWMLNDLRITTGESIPIFPDPWHTTKERAYQLIRDDLKAMANDDNVQVQVEKLSHKRVYMPTYIFDYTLFQMEYRAFISGCDIGSSVSGISHQVFPSFGDLSADFTSKRTIFTNISSIARTPIGKTLVTFVLQTFGNFATRIALRLLPLVSVFSGAFVGYRKIIQPWMDQRYASAEWERERENEKYEEYQIHNDFRDAHAKHYFQRHKKNILRQWNQSNDDWYSNWESSQQQSYQHQNDQQSQRTKSRTWDFDPKDPYSVLGIHPNASVKEVSEAFRKEMLKHHPDLQAGASQQDKKKAMERSKYITEAYRTIKSQMKRS